MEKKFLTKEQIQIKREEILNNKNLRDVHNFLNKMDNEYVYTEGSESIHLFKSLLNQINEQQSRIKKMMDNKGRLTRQEKPFLKREEYGTGVQQHHV